MRWLSAYCAQTLSCGAAEAPFRWVAWVEVCRVGPHLGEAAEAGAVLPVVALRQQDGHCGGSPLVAGPGDDRGRPLASRSSAARTGAEQAQGEFC